MVACLTPYVDGHIDRVQVHYFLETDGVHVRHAILLLTTITITTPTTTTAAAAADTVRPATRDTPTIATATVSITVAATAEHRLPRAAAAANGRHAR